MESMRWEEAAWFLINTASIEIFLVVVVGGGVDYGGGGE